MKKMLVLVDAPGPADSILPVLPLLQNSFDISLVTVKNSPTKILQEFNPRQCDDESEVAEIYASIQPDIVFATTSSLLLGPYVINAFLKIASDIKTPIICFQDYWANHRQKQNKEIIDLYDTVLTVDERAETYLKEDGFSKPIIITGNPAFDKLQTIDVAEERKHLRLKFGIPEDQFVLMWIGRGTPQDWEREEITYRFFVKSISEMKNQPLVFVHPHPRDEKPTRYQAINPDSQHLPGYEGLPIESAVPMTDAVIGMDSTTHIHACYLRIPAVTILLPNAGQERLRRVNLKDFPPNETGASLGIYEENPKALLDLLESIKNDPAFQANMKTAQEKMFPHYSSSSAHNVADAVLKFSEQN